MSAGEDVLVCLQAGGGERAACSGEDGCWVAPVPLKDAGCCRLPLRAKTEIWTEVRWEKVSTAYWLPAVHTHVGIRSDCLACSIQSFFFF